MQNEELYRALYSKYAPNLTGAELDTKINYALDSDSTEFINAFYQKYTGEDPTEEQLNYIKSFTAEPGKKKGSADATPDVGPIVTESGLDVGTLGLPETSEELNVNLLAISNGVTKNHIKVKNRLAEEYFSLDNFKQSRVKVGSGTSFQGYARSEEDDLKSWFGEEKYEQYLQYKQSEVFDSKWVDNEIVKQIVGVVKQEEVEQYIGRLDIGDVKPDFKGHKDMVADARKAVQEGIFNIFDPEDASVTGDGQNWLQQYIDALAIDKAKETKQKELGKTSVFFGDRATDEEIMKLRVQDSAAEKVLANYFNHKFTGYKKKSKDWNTKYNDYIKVNKTYEPQFNRISTSLNALGKVDEYSSKEKIEQYNNLVAEGNNLSAEYKKALSDQNLNFEDITSEAASLQSGFDKLVDNFDKVSEVTTIAKALALDYGWLNATSLSFESGMAEMGAWISSALKGFAYAADKVEGFGSAFADPTKLKQIMVNPQDFLSEDQNTAHMDRWRGLNASVISYNESVQNYKQASLPLDIDWDDVGWDNIGQWSSQALSNNAFSISTALAYGGAIRAGMNVPKATKILSGTFFGLEGGAKYTHMEIDQKNAGKYIAGLQESLKSATTKGERVQILDQIDYYEKALNATEMEKAFSSIAYGGIAMYAERLGTMRTLRNLNRISPTNNRLTIANTMKSTWQVGKGVGIEYIEEFATQVGHNLVDMTVLDQNKSLLDGIDNNFNANIIFSTLAIQGPSVSMNVFNSIRGEVITQGEILENRKRTNQIIEINGALQADQESGFKLLDAGTREFMESENRRLIREAGMKDAEMFANVANMTAAEVKEMFAINQKKRDKLKQVQNLGASSAYEKAGSNYIEKQKEKLVNDIKNLNGQRDQLRGKPGARRKEIIEATLKNDKIQVETEFYLGKAYAAKNIVKGLGNVKEFGKINQDGTIDLTDLETYLDKKVKKGNITEGQKKEYLKGFRQGHNASFVGNDVILIESNMIRNINSAETALEKSIHAYSVIHELQHINDVKTGLVQDLDVVESSKIAVEGIQDEVETLYKQGKIKEKDYVSFIKRVGQYTKDNNGTVDLMELLTIAGELKDAGVLSENSTDPLLSLKLMINQFSNKYFKKGDMFFKLNNTQDVLGYIDSFQRSTRNQTLVLGPEEEVKKPKFSQTTAEKAAKEKAVNDLGKMGWTDKTWKESGAKFAIETIKDEKLIDGLVYAQYKVEDVPVNFVNDVITELSADIKKFNSSYTKKNGEKVKAKWGTEQENDSLFGYLQGLIKFRAGDVYKKLYKSDDAIKGAKNIGETTKEGEVKIQVAAETDAAMEAFETEDLSIEGRAKKEKVDKQRYSEYRRKLGFETGSKIYNEVLDNVKKSLIMAYGATQNIEDVQLRAKAIAVKLKKEYANLDSPLFKQIKNFLTYGVADVFVKRGTKDIYFTQLKNFREDIVKNISTADLVQMERNTPDADKIFVNFVKTLTSIEQVRDAVNKEKLPPEALNKITKDKKTGKGSFSPSLYDKIMPTPDQLVGWADQPIKKQAVSKKTGELMFDENNNPIMVRSGLKGTRKDGIAMRMVNGLVTDAIMEARQSEEVQSKIAEMDIDPGSVAELGAAIGREVNVKFSKSNAIGDISAAIDGAGDVNVYSQIKFSKAHRDVYEKQLTKRRPDLTEDQRKNAVQSVFDFVDGKEIPNNKKSKYEKMAMHYMANGYLILPEDGYKVIEAEKIATQKKLDPFSFKNPNVLIETYVGEVKGTRTNPDNVKTFSNKTELTNGVTVYDVEDSKQGQLDTRKVIDTHFGKKANPWCLCARTGEYIESDEAFSEKEAMEMKKAHEAFGRTVQITTYKAVEDDASYANIKKGDTIWELSVTDNKKNLDAAFRLWKDYNKEGNGHKIAFQNGRLVSFRDGNKMQWWDRNDKPSNAVVVRGKKGKDGFKPVIEVGKTKETILAYEKVTGNKKNGTTIEKDLDGSLILQETKKDGQFYGEQIRVKDKGEYKATFTENYRKGGERFKFKEERVYTDKNTSVRTNVGKGQVINLNNITKYERSFAEKDFEVSAERIIIEGTVNQKYFKEFNDPSSATGWEKTNLPYLTPTYERYYGIQGQKVTVVETNGRDQYSSELFIENKYPKTIREADRIVEKEIAKGRTAIVMEREGDFYVSILENVQEGNNVTVDGIVQAPNVKFSKSAENNVKFSLTSKQQDRNVLPAILKKQLDVERIITKEGATESDLILLEYLNEFEAAITSGLHYEEAYNSFINNLPEAAKNSLVNFKDIQSFEKSVVDTQVPQIRSLGLDAAGVYFKNKFNKLTTTKDKVDLVNKFLTNIGISARGGKGLVKSYTNQQLLEGPVTKIFGKKFVEKHFNLTEVKKGKTIKYRYGNKAYEPVPLYKDIDIIKESRGETSVVKGVNGEAKEARAFVQEIIDSNISVSEKLAIIDLLSLNQRGAIRKMYTFGETVTSKVKKPATELVLEHEITAKNMTKYLRQRVKDILNQTQLEEIMDQAKVHVWNNNIDTILNDQGLRQEGGRKRYQNKEVKNYLQIQKDKGLITDIPSTIKPVNNLPKAVQFSRSANNPTKGITVLDFDDTLATSKSMIRFTRPDGTKGTLNAEQYASTYESLSDLGYKFDFSEFTKVVDGKTAPLFNKAMKLQGKFGPESMFVLTARPAESAAAIHAFLKANGLNIPLKNITGLANSTSEAKALWIAEKVGEGYNDFYFADDALQNVQAVQNMLDQFDVKSKVQQAKVKFSKNMDTEFNDILENITGIESKKRFSIIKGRKRGESKGKFRFFIPPSHEDFVGLLYNFMGKGKEGNAHRDFFEQALVRPLNRGYREIDTAKQAIANDYKSLNKQFPEVKDKLVKATPDGDFTFQDAIRVYLWDKHGHKIPGLTETDQKKLAELVMSDSQLQAYAETLNIISKQENYVAPGQAWETANIRIDLVDATGRVGRADYFTEFNENAEVIFSEENLNKIEAAYGRSAREAIEDMLHRIKTGVNRPKGTNGKPNMFMNWLNASVSGVMFFNTRSALLQQLSNVNFLNFADNNIFKAGLAFANQPQYWKDFAMIFNSDMLKQRRGGLGTDINGAELADAIKKARPDNMFDQVSIVVGKALKLGFLPTQIGDNIAIATGGAAFYRNRVNKYVKDGLSVKEAETKAFTDLQNITQSTQQSARPDMTSQQQASWIGKLVLNFLNTPSQYNRIIKKAGLDIKNRRITPPNTTQLQSDMSNMSRILYYGAAQNLIFYSLQTALFAVMFDGDDEESEAFLKKKERVINGSIDTILRGSGIYGVGISTLKNMMIKFLEQREKGYNKDESAVIMEMLNFSPVVGIKARKVVNAEKTLNYNKDIISEMETFDIDNPQWSAVTNYVESITTAPVNRIYQKTINLRNAADNQYTAFQRALFFSGYTTWSLDLGDTKKMENIKSKVKDKKKKQRKKKKKKKLIY